MFHSDLSLFWPHWPCNQKLNDCQNSHRDITRQWQWEIYVLKMIQTRRTGAGGEVGSYSLIVLGLQCKSHGLEFNIAPFYWQKIALQTY